MIYGISISIFFWLFFILFILSTKKLDFDILMGLGYKIITIFDIFLWCQQYNCQKTWMENQKVESLIELSAFHLKTDCGTEKRLLDNFILKVAFFWNLNTLTRLEQHYQARAQLWRLKQKHFKGSSCGQKSPPQCWVVSALSARARSHLRAENP